MATAFRFRGFAHPISDDGSVLLARVDTEIEQLSSAFWQPFFVNSDRDRCGPGLFIRCDCKAFHFKFFSLHCETFQTQTSLFASGYCCTAQLSVHRHFNVCKLCHWTKAKKQTGRVCLVAKRNRSWLPKRVTCVIPPWQQLTPPSLTEAKVDSC